MTSQKNVVKKRSSSLIPPHLPVEKQDNAIIEDWLAERLTDKLRKASIVVQQTHRSHLLYRNTIEKSQDVLQEEVGIISGKHIVVMIYVYGGFLPSTFQKIEVYTSDKFIKWIIKKGKTHLLLQCLESLA
ncbi:MAG: hypothetical protein WA364_27920 [Candidatus Nitrosopolaris sp.]